MEQSVGASRLWIRFLDNLADRRLTSRICEKQGTDLGDVYTSSIAWSGLVNATNIDPCPAQSILTATW